MKLYALNYAEIKSKKSQFFTGKHTNVFVLMPAEKIK